MKSLVISGGGSKGAFAGGVVQYLKENGSDWDMFAGTSTGSLIIPLVACNKVDVLKDAYTNIVPEDIFKINPFRIIKQKNGNIRFGINHFKIACNFIFNGSKTLGDSSNLRNTVCRFLSETDFNEIKNSDKEVIVTVCNLTLETLEIKSIKDETYDDFCDWMCASSSAAPFMSVVTKNKYDYIDGGMLRFIPLIEAIEMGSTEIDAIVLMEDHDEGHSERVTNVLQLLTKMIRIFLGSRKRHDADVQMLSKNIDDDREVRLRIYFLPDKLTNNPYVFNKEMMLKWWDMGYSNAKELNYSEYILTKRKVKKII